MVVVIPPTLERTWKTNTQLKVSFYGVRRKERFLLLIIGFEGGGSLSIGVLCAKGMRRRLVIFSFIAWWHGSFGLGGVFLVRLEVVHFKE